MTSKGESQLVGEILTELDTLYGKFAEQDGNLAALLVTVDALVVTIDGILDTVNGNIGAAVGASLTADLAVLNTEADTMLTAA